MTRTPIGIFVSPGESLPRLTPYRFDPSRCQEPLTGIVHQLAWCAAAAECRPHSTIPTREEEAAREREAAAWNPPGRYQGD
jgi:hypothetical protein